MGKIQKIYMNLLSFYLDIYLILKIKEREFQLQFAIEYISLNNSSYKYQACKIQYVNLYLKLGLLILKPHLYQYV